MKQRGWAHHAYAKGGVRQAEARRGSCCVLSSPELLRRPRMGEYLKHRMCSSGANATLFSVQWTWRL